MSANDVIVLNSILEQKKKIIADSLTDSDFFELFTFEQILKNYDLSYEELLCCQIGDSDDGGIDGFFTFINDELLTEDIDIDTIKKNPLIELFLIQAKISTLFTETAVEHIIATVEDIFDLTKDINTLRNFYNSGLIDKADLIRRAYIKLAVRHPQLKINFMYASKGDITKIHPKVENKTNTLTKTISKLFSEAAVVTNFFGARELLDASRREKSYTLQLRFLENYISRGEDNYVVLASLKDYYNFVVDEKDNLRRYIFESNVRDYQGNVEVNKDIQ